MEKAKEREEKNAIPGRDTFVSERRIPNKKRTTIIIIHNQVVSSLILQNTKFLPLAAAVPHAALAAVSLAVEGIFGLLLLRGVEEEAAAAQGFSVVEEDVGFVLVHFSEDDDVGRVVLRKKRYVSK